MLASICIFARSFAIGEQHRRVERCRHRLAHGHAARYDDAVDRRGDRAVVEVDLRRLEVRLVDLQRRLRLMLASRSPCPGPLGRRVSFTSAGFRWRSISPAPASPARRPRSPPPCATLPCRARQSITATSWLRFHERVEIHVHPVAMSPGYLAAHGHTHHRVQLPGRASPPAVMSPRVTVPVSYFPPPDGLGSNTTSRRPRRSAPAR